MKERRKSGSCLNCGTQLREDFNFCPVCGQENTDSHVSFSQLVKEFFVNYFSLDSRLGNSIKPFLFQPGILTNRFHEGKRLSFMNPVRLYIILSLFYFFVFTKAGQTLVVDDDVEGSKVTSSQPERIERIQGLNSTLRKKLSSELDSSEIAALNAKLDDANLLDFYTALSDSQMVKLYPILRDAGFDSTQIFDPDKLFVTDSDRANFTVAKTDDNSFILNRIDFNKMNKLIKDDLSDQAIYDSLEVGEVNFFEDLIVKQIIRINKADEETVTTYILQNVPLMMFLLVPIFALILKLFYIRRNILYIRHMVHAIHLHSFAYFIYGIAIIFMFWIVGETAAAFIGIIAFFMVSIHSFVSFKRVYQQHWFKTLVKFILVGCFYILFVWVFFAAELLISALLF